MTLVLVTGVAFTVGLFAVEALTVLRSFVRSASLRGSRPSRSRQGAGVRGASRGSTTLPCRPVAGPASPYLRNVRVVERRKVDPHWSSICPDCGGSKDPEWMLCNDCGIRLADLIARRHRAAAESHATIDELASDQGVTAVHDVDELVASDITDEEATAFLDAVSVRGVAS